MIDKKLGHFLQPPLTGIARMLQRMGVTADWLTLAGFVIGLFSILALATHQNYVALACLLASRLFDGLDGALARLIEPTDQGAFLDISFDFIFYSGFVLAAAFAQPTNALFCAFLIFSFVANGTAFLAFSVFVERYKISADVLKSKSMYFLGGLAEGFETIVAFTLICLFPSQLPTIAIIFGSLCCISAAYRVGFGYNDLARRSSINKP